MKRFSPGVLLAGFACVALAGPEKPVQADSYTVESAQEANEEDRTTYQSACNDFYSDAAARSEFDAQFADPESRDAAACAIGVMVVFEVSQTEMTDDLGATAAVACGVYAANSSGEDLEKKTR